MAAIQTASGNNRCRATLVHVVSGTSESGVVANVGVDVEIASPSLSVQKLFLLPVCVVVILCFPCRPTSGHVVSMISESGMIENVGVAAEIALLSFSVQKLFLLPVCIIAILRFPCRPTSGHVVCGISESGMVENVGVAAEIASPSVSVQQLFPLPVSTSGFHFRVCGRHMSFRCRLMWDNVGSVISKSGWSKMWR